MKNKKWKILGEYVIWGMISLIGIVLLINYFEDRKNEERIREEERLIQRQEVVFESKREAVDVIERYIRKLAETTKDNQPELTEDVIELLNLFDMKAVEREEYEELIKKIHSYSYTSQTTSSSETASVTGEVPAKLKHLTIKSSNGISEKEQQEAINLLSKLPSGILSMFKQIVMEREGEDIETIDYATIEVNPYEIAHPNHFYYEIGNQLDEMLGSATTSLSEQSEWLAISREEWGVDDEEEHFAQGFANYVQAKLMGPSQNDRHTPKTMQYFDALFQKKQWIWD